MDLFKRNNKALKKGMKKANKDIFKLVQKVLKKTPRPSDGKRITRRSGNLFSQIRPILKLQNKTLIIDIEVMEYYLYLDEGTKHIDPWLFTAEILESQEMMRIIEDLTLEGLEEVTIEALNNIKK